MKEKSKGFHNNLATNLTSYHIIGYVMRLGFDFSFLRNWGGGLVLSILVFSSVSAQNVSITDYQVPVSTADQLIIDFSANYAKIGADTTTSKGNVDGVYKRFYDSLPFGYSIDMIGSGSVVRDIIRDKYQTDYILDGEARVKKYLLRNNAVLKNLFGSVRLNSSLLKSYNQPASAVTVGVGYGRFIEATPLAKAVRIEAFLMKEGELKGRLPKAAILEVSQIINRRQEYQDKYGGVYKKEWYDDIEAVIRESGLLHEDALGAIGVLRMNEALEREKIAERFYGWDVTLGSKFDITQPDTDQRALEDYRMGFDIHEALLTTWGDVKTRFAPPGIVQDRLSTNLDVSANYARPISWRWQVSERFSMNTPFDELGTSIVTSLSSDISYELSNRIDFRLRHLIQIRKPEAGDSQFRNSLGLSLIYYIENYINLVATEQIEKAPNKAATTNFTIALNYRVF
ncbi:hypothetical protein HYR99_08575 [Candidatus Poribacteria bacterium]|nr:hypothetical protein [Candidatus Poribacteria bacterium]